MVQSPQRGLYYCWIKVSRRPGSDIPEEYRGAYVPAFAIAEDHQQALGLIIPGLAEDGWQFEELMQNRVDEMVPEHWDAFVDATWPEHRERIPDGAAIEELMSIGGFFFGPLSVWSEDAGDAL